MATPQKERESFEKNGCNSLDCAVDNLVKVHKLKRAAKRVAYAPIPSSKVGKMRVDALNRFKKQAEKLK